jgi:hypothetical protein
MSPDATVPSGPDGAGGQPDDAPDDALGDATDDALGDTTVDTTDDALGDAAVDASIPVPPTESGTDASESGLCGTAVAYCDGSNFPLDNDPTNCGACGHDCTRFPGILHGFLGGPGCASCTCAYVCASGYADCDDAGTGCNTVLGTTANCGHCGDTCSGATPYCQTSQVNAKGVCVGTCDAGLRACNDTCVSFDIDPSDCGTCVMPGGTNLLSNGGFDTNVDGWTPLDPNIVLGFAAADIVVACTTSGSLLAKNRATALDSGFVQCVPVTAGQSYNVGGWIRTPSTSGPGQTSIQLVWFTGANCQGTSSGGALLQANGTRDLWELLSQDNLVAPRGTASAYVYGELATSPNTGDALVPPAYFSDFDLMYLSPSPGHF